MANEEKRYPSRMNKKNRTTPVANKKNRSNSVLNMMIGLVFTLILITGAFIFLDKEEGSIEQPESVKIASEAEQPAEEGSAADEPEGDAASSGTDNGSEEETEEAKEAEEAPAEPEAKPEETKEGKVTGGTITKEDSNDPVVKETIINTSWEPVGTSQKGEHVSVYQKGSADWNEKIKAISYATGLAEDDMYIMMIKNGGGPQKSVGVVQSKDQSKKFRVHMQWVDGKGWNPVKLDVLKTLKGAY